MGAIQNSVNQTIGLVATAAGIGKHLQGQQEQVQATKENTDIAKQRVQLAQEQGKGLNNIQAQRIAMEKLMNAQYPHRNLKGWDPEKHLEGQKLNDYNDLNNSLTYLKGEEMDYAKGIGKAIGVTSSKAYEDENDMKREEETRKEFENGGNQ